MDIANFPGMRLVSLDVNATVWVPESYGSVLSTAQTVVSIAIESCRQDRPLVALKHVYLLRRQQLLLLSTSSTHHLCKSNNVNFLKPPQIFKSHYSI